jgi:protein-tyrosine phosphatase
MLVDILDNSKANLIEHMPAYVAFIENALEHGNVLVHCTKGASRSTSAVIGWLMARFRIPFD